MVGFSCTCLLTPNPRCFAPNDRTRTPFPQLPMSPGTVVSEAKLPRARPSHFSRCFQRGSKDSAHSRQHCILRRLRFVREVCRRLKKADSSPTRPPTHVWWELEQHGRKVGGGSQRARLTCSLSHNLREVPALPELHCPPSAGRVLGYILWSCSEA